MTLREVFDSAEKCIKWFLAHPDTRELGEQERAYCSYADEALMLIHDARRHPDNAQALDVVAVVRAAEQNVWQRVIEFAAAARLYPEAPQPTAPAKTEQEFRTLLASSQGDPDYQREKASMAPECGRLVPEADVYYPVAGPPKHAVCDNGCAKGCGPVVREPKEG